MSILNNGETKHERHACVCVFACVQAVQEAEGRKQEAGRGRKWKEEVG